MTKKIQLNISGITCQACVRLIAKRLSTIDGVVKSNIDKSGLTEIFAQKTIDIASIQSVLKDTDYKVTNAN